MPSETCRICGRPLFTEKSIRRGVGPICWKCLPIKPEKEEAEIHG